ncbi:MAG: class I SAM-dependent methyltransferase family protein [Candidatus Norongarragalinales archaeon]
MRSTLAVKIACRDAERARRELVAAKALCGDLVPERSKKFVFFPVTKKICLNVPHSFERKRFKTRNRIRGFKELLAEFLSARELAAVIKSFDVVGEIAVIQVPQRLASKAKRIAQALLASNNRIKTVLQKTSGRQGDFRLQRVRWLAGARRFTTIHKENNCLLRVDLRRTYYSPRLSTERARVASLVKQNERVLVPFAGVGPFVLPIARQGKAAEVVAIELNPAAARLLKENVCLNRASDRVRVIQGDAARVMASREFRGWADRIVMPLPHTARSFLPSALKALKRGGTIHFYRIVLKTQGATELEREAREACAQAGKKFKKLGSRRVIVFSPSRAEFVLDFKVF